MKLKHLQNPVFESNLTVTEKMGISLNTISKLHTKCFSEQDKHFQRQDTQVGPVSKQFYSNILQKRGCKAISLALTASPVPHLKEIKSHRLSQKSNYKKNQQEFKSVPETFNKSNEQFFFRVPDSPLSSEASFQTRSKAEAGRQRSCWVRIGGSAQIKQEAIQMRHNVQVSNTNLWIKNHFANLREFLEKLFSYHRILTPQVSSLSIQEKQILLEIFESKNYSLQDQLRSVLNGRIARPQIWTQFHKTKRKEEYIKYGYKILVKDLFKEFENGDLPRLKTGLKAPVNQNLLFYLFNFGHLEFQEPLQQILQNLGSHRWCEREVWVRLRRFVFPEICFHANIGQAKSINKRFLKSVVSAREMAQKMLLLATDIMIFLGYCWKTPWTRIPPARRTRMDWAGIRLLKKIGFVNRNEIQKLFTEWSNLIGLKTYSEGQLDHFETIRGSIGRINFKFPWSFKEVQHGMIHTFLSLVEVIHFDFLPADSESKESIGLTEGLQCGGCPKSNCAHIYPLRKKLMKKFKGFFIPNSELYQFFLGTLNRDVLGAAAPGLSFPEFRRIFGGRVESLGTLLKDPRVLGFVSTYLFNFVLKSEINQNSCILPSRRQFALIRDRFNCEGTSSGLL